MKFTCIATGNTQFGVWATGTFYLNEILEINSIFRIETNKEIKNNTAYVVSKIKINKKKDSISYTLVI